MNSPSYFAESSDVWRIKFRGEKQRQGLDTEVGCEHEAAGGGQRQPREAGGADVEAPGVQVVRDQEDGGEYSEAGHCA